MTTKKTATKPKYSASVRVLGKVYKATGGDPYSTIAKLKPGNVRGVSILSMTGGKRTVEKVLSPMQTMRLFNTAGMTREVQLKNVSLMFDGL